MRGIGKSTGIAVTPIPHAGGAQTMTTLVGAQTMIGGSHPGEAISQLKANRVRAIGIATPDRDPALPNVPTLKEQGINFHTWGSIKGVGAPKGTSKEIVDYYKINPDKVTTTVMPIKSFVQGMNYNEDLGRVMPYVLKYAVVPIFPNWYTDNSEVSTMVNKMVDANFS